MAIIGGTQGRQSQPGMIGYSPVAPSNVFGDPNSFSKAADRQGGDYSSIMGGYGDILNKSSSTPISYNPSGDITNNLNNLSQLAITGGYSPQDISDLRERAISPTRSIYANAQQNLQRQRSLQGGYSPGFGALTARMARDQSQQISDVTGNANAGIAENVVRNRLAASPMYASLAEGEANRGLDVSKFNSELGFRDTANKLQSLEGMRSIYGTNPALTSEFGKNVVSAAQLGQNQQEINNRRSANTLGITSRIFT